MKTLKNESRFSVSTARSAAAIFAAALALQVPPVAAEERITNAPTRKGDINVVQAFGEGNLLLRNAQIGGESVVIDSVRVCDQQAARRHGEITNAPRIEGKTTIVGGKKVTAGSVELGC